MRRLFVFLLGVSLFFSPVTTAKPFQFSLSCALAVMFVSGVIVGVVTPEGKWATSATRGRYLLGQPVDRSEEKLTLSRYEDLANFEFREPTSTKGILQILGIRRWLKFYQRRDEKFALELRANGIPVDTEEKFLQFIGCSFSGKDRIFSYSYFSWYFDRRRAVARLYAKVLIDQAQNGHSVGIKDNSEFLESLYYSSLSLPE